MILDGPSCYTFLAVDILLLPALPPLTFVRLVNFNYFPFPVLFSLRFLSLNLQALFFLPPPPLLEIFEISMPRFFFFFLTLLNCYSWLFLPVYKYYIINGTFKKLNPVSRYTFTRANINWNWTGGGERNVMKFPLIKNVY